MFPTTLQHIYLLKETFSQPNLTMFEKVGMTGLYKSSHSIKALPFNCCAQTKMALLAVHRYCIKNYSDLNIFF